MLLNLNEGMYYIQLLHFIESDMMYMCYNITHHIAQNEVLQLFYYISFHTINTNLKELAVGLLYLCV